MDGGHEWRSASEELIARKENLFILVSDSSTKVTYTIYAHVSTGVATNTSSVMNEPIMLAQS